MAALVVQKAVIGAQRIIEDARHHRINKTGGDHASGKDAGTGLRFVPTVEVKQRGNDASVVGHEKEESAHPENHKRDQV